MSTIILFHLNWLATRVLSDIRQVAWWLCARAALNAACCKINGEACRGDRTSALSEVVLVRLVHVSGGRFAVCSHQTFNPFLHIHTVVNKPSIHHPFLWHYALLYKANASARSNFPLFTYLIVAHLSSASVKEAQSIWKRKMGEAPHHRLQRYVFKVEFGGQTSLPFTPHQSSHSHKTLHSHGATAHESFCKPFESRIAFGCSPLLKFVRFNQTSGSCTPAHHRGCAL